MGRLFQRIGGTDNLRTALGIFTQLRTRAAGGKVNTPCDDKDRTNTPCDDKDIELALGRNLQIMGDADNLKAALDIFVRLRTQAASGKATPLSGDKDIELSLAAIFIDTGAWEQFDGLQLDKQLFSGPEVCLCLSIRYFQELMDVE
ncbi:hypothetical protein, partial [Sansalvadorimonas verongulae]|uniref:hypothetical protein n=1 Tax=Sansalvadorimonas verongulae TaxID=2172824 RepID=UPI001E62D9FB